MMKDFKAFVMRGNVMDLAVAVIIGAAFGKIVSSLVADVLMPVIGLVSGGVDFTNLHVRIGGTDAEPVTLAYGNFIQATIDFLVIAVVVFLMVRLMSAVRKPAAPEPTTKPCPRCTKDVPRAATRCPFCTSEIGG